MVSGFEFGPTSLLQVGFGPCNESGSSKVVIKANLSGNVMSTLNKFVTSAFQYDNPATLNA